MNDLKPAAPAAQPAQKIVTELKVSANLMTLDTGLYCIFNAPGGPLPDPATGLPGVRVTLPPGAISRPEAITIQAFREDGWLGGWHGAALVRVSRGPAQVLVTIYQTQNTTLEAPRLQILRLADAASLPPLGARPPPAPLPAGQPAPVAAGGTAVPPPIKAVAAGHAGGEIVAHVQTRGDVTVGLEDWMGEPGSKRWIEGFSITPKAPVGAADIEYQAVLGRGWLSPWAEGGQYCGSRGMSLPILGLRIRLRGDAADRFDCFLESSFVDGTRLPESDNGEPCQADSLAPLEAFRVRIVARGGAAKSGGAADAKTGAGPKVGAKPLAPPLRPAAQAPKLAQAPGKPLAPAPKLSPAGGKAQPRKK